MHHTQRLLLIRHAEATGQAPECDLTDAGCAQADRLSKRLSDLGVDRLYSSPFRRAIKTLQPFAEHAELGIEIIDEWRERVLARKPLADWQDHIKRSFQDRDYAAPGGESHNHVSDRAIASLTSRDSWNDGIPAIASHGNLISSLLSLVDAKVGFEDWAGMRNPDLFWLEFDGVRPIGYQRETL